MIKGIEFHSIVEHIFGEVKGMSISSQLQVNCPRCQERDGLPEPDGKFNLEISTSSRTFRCWKCEEPKFSGTLGKLIYTFGTKADSEIYKSFASVYNDYNIDNEIDYEEEHLREAVELPVETIFFSQMDATNPEHFEAYNYLVNDRKITRDIILKYRLGFCITGKYEKRIIIPSYDRNGNVNYFVARNYDTANKKKKPYDNPKSDKSQIIFNEGMINWDSPVWLVEGGFDMLSFPVNSIPMLGKTVSPLLFLKLKEIKPEVGILLDPDAYKSGIELFYKLQNIYVGCEERVKIVKLPNNDDIDEVRKLYGIDEVIKCLRTARGLTVEDYFIRTLQMPYDNKGNKRRDSYSKYFEWRKDV
jgi:hypothetical protein